MGVDTKIMFISGLEENTLHKTQFNDCRVAILLLASEKHSSRMPSWHPPDSDSGMVRDDESTIQVHNDANACFFWIPLDYKGIDTAAGCDLCFRQQLHSRNH